MTDLKILIIDDNSDDRTLVLRELKQLFPQLIYWEVGDATNLDRALQANEFNLVITDYHLGWTTGLEIFKDIKQQNPDCPVIMFTGTGNEEVAVEAMKAGVDDYIVKSVASYVRVATVVRSCWERLQQQQAITELKQRYERLFERVPIGLYRLDPLGKILEVNSALVEMLGYSDRQDLLNCNLADFYFDYRRKLPEELDGDRASTSFEVQTRCQNGKIIWMRHLANAVRCQSGEIIYYEGAVEDISDRLAAERERTELLQRERQAREAAETANRLKDRFFATLSHELRTPLNSILGWIQLLRSGQLDERRSQKAIETIERNARTQNRTIEDLLDIGRITRNDLKLNLVPTPLSVPITAAIENTQALADAKQVELQTDLDPDLKEVNADPQRLQQVFENILTNGIQFTPTGGKVSLTLEYYAKRARICIRDTGKGIDPEIFPYIFELFQQANKNRDRSSLGLGLGLAIAKHLVELHGGIIVARSSETDKGATFIVELPLIDSKLARN